MLSIDLCVLAFMSIKYLAGCKDNLYLNAPTAEDLLEKGKDNDKDQYNFFLKRSKSWQNIYNPKIKWLNSKYPNNIWKDINHDWREGTYKNYFWMVPYDLDGLIQKIGGKKIAQQRLDSLFIRLDARYEDKWFASGNEPDFHVPWV